MSLVGTLGRMAVGVMVAKGVGKMMSNRQARGAGQGSSAGGLGGMLGGLLGGQGGGAGGAGGGLAGGLGGLLGGGGRSGGGLGDLGKMLGGRSAAGAAGAAGAGGALAGGLGGLLEKIGGGGATGGAAGGTAGGGAAPGASPSGGSFGDLLNSSLAGESATPADPGQEEHAKLLIRAMVNAAKSDGRIDEEEQKRIVEHIGDEATAEDREFVLAEMRAPLDVDGFVKSVPRGAEREVYMMSVMGIDLDEQSEARYLDTLRKGMNLSEADANAIHQQLGVPALYS